MNIYKEIDKLLSDNRSGSSALLARLLDLLEEYHNDAGSYSIQDLKSILNRLIDGFRGFSIYFHFYRAFNNRLKVLEGYRFPTNDIKKEMSQFLLSYKGKWKDVNDRIAASVVTNLDLKNKKVLLHSNSLTIRSVFSILCKKDICPDIIQTVSYPAKEGILQAKFLAGKKLNITLITDASVSLFIPAIDYAILGADAIFEKSFINKTGSMLIALACKHYNKELYVFSDSRKKTDRDMTSGTFFERLRNEKEKPPEEILSNAPDNIHPSNRYFEEIPVSLVSRFFYEE
ncbi:MAG: hypothetical protein HQ543_08920 [Bacteroidetes bacterium]|nr:hypothetical protein [Bacteroidota bacterium]